MGCLSFALYGFVGSEIGAVAAYQATLGSDRPLDFGLTRHTAALQASRDAMFGAAIAAALAGTAAEALARGRCRSAAIAIGLAAALLTGETAGLCSAR
jgi:hypothetical protein